MQFCISSHCSVLKQQPLPLYYTHAVVISPSTARVVREISDEAAETALLCLCLLRAVLEWTGLSILLIYIYIGNPVLPLAFSSSRRLPLSAPRRMVNGRDYQWAVIYLLTPPHPPPTVFITSLFRPLPHHFSINHRHSVHRCWNTIL